MLWTNALELVQESPLTGWGNLWLREWRQTTYSDVGYNLLHNGYLEILARHGLLGILFLLVFAAVAMRRIHRAYASGSLATSTMNYLYIQLQQSAGDRRSFFILAGCVPFALLLLERGVLLETASGKPTKLAQQSGSR